MKTSNSAAGHDVSVAARAGDSSLLPPNEMPHVVLPPQDQVASANPNATDAIVRAYPDAIEFADQIGEIAGYLATVGMFMVPVCAWGFVASLELGGLLTQMFAAILLLTAVGMIRLDFHGQRHDPVLFNRALGKVHIMETLPLSWFEFLFVPWKVAGKMRIHTYPWDCARGEVAGLQVFQGTVLRKEHNLFLAFTDAPGTQRVVYRSAVGTTTAYDDGLGCINRWEHIRRFMRHEGPAFREGDRPWSSGAMTFWQGLFHGQMLLGPGSATYWRSRSPWVYIGGALSILIWPMTAFHGLVRWGCYAVRREPKWPAEIAASIGPGWTPDELRAMGRGDVRLG